LVHKKKKKISQSKYDESTLTQIVMVRQFKEAWDFLKIYLLIKDAEWMTLEENLNHLMHNQEQQNQQIRTSKLPQNVQIKRIDKLYEKKYNLSFKTFILNIWC